MKVVKPRGAEILDIELEKERDAISKGSCFSDDPSQEKTGVKSRLLTHLLVIIPRQKGQLSSSNPWL